MAKRRVPLSLFNLSFLDIMFCGFGAVVLLVLIIHSRIKTENIQHTESLAEEISQIEKQLQSANKYNLRISESLQNTKNESQQIKIDIDSQVIKSQLLKQQKAVMLQQTLTQRNYIESLKKQLKQIEKENKSQLFNDETTRLSRDKLLKFVGDGQRQYLSGLKLGGKHILIFLDVSASMLDSTIVNIIRRRNMSEAKKRTSEKWQRALKTVHWLVSNLPLESSLQIIIFNTKAKSLLHSDKLSWIKSRDIKKLNQMMNKLESVIPSGGTSIVNAFAMIKKMKPLPDNVFLLTDGLPTQGRISSGKSKITGAERANLLKQAVKLVPGYIPVNTILYPLEGDPMAAALYWKLAVDTHGSFLTPSRDWP
jgi:hypothetical protein